MRMAEISTGSVEVVGLTRKQIRGGKEFGLRYFGINGLDDHFEDARDYCLGCLFDETVLDQMLNKDQNILFTALIFETWGDAGEEKNSPVSGQNGQTETEQ